MPSLHKLAAIEGIGEAKLNRYGAAILSIVGQERLSEMAPVEGKPDEQSTEK